MWPDWVQSGKEHKRKGLILSLDQISRGTGDKENPGEGKRKKIINLYLAKLWRQYILSYLQFLEL